MKFAGVGALMLSACGSTAAPIQVEDSDAAVPTGLESGCPPPHTPLRYPGGDLPLGAVGVRLCPGALTTAADGTTFGAFIQAATWILAHGVDPTCRSSMSRAGRASTAESPSGSRTSSEGRGTPCAKRPPVAPRTILRRSGGQAQFSALLAGQAADTEPVRDLLSWLRDHLTDDLSVAALARQINLSERQFTRADVSRDHTAATSAAWRTPIRCHERSG